VSVLLRRLAALAAVVCVFGFAGCAGSGDDEGTPAGPAAPAEVRFVGTWRLPEVGRGASSGFDVTFTADGTLEIAKNGAASASARGTWEVSSGFLSGEWRAVSGSLRGRAEAFFESESVLHFAFIELNTNNPAAANGYLRSDHRGTRLR